MQRFDKVVFTVIMVVFVSLFFVMPISAWEPYKGRSIVDQTQTKQWFTFSQAAIKEFDSKSTYEHETQIYDKKFADCEKAGHKSNLPRYYLDTQAFDFYPLASNKVDNFTIGSAEASAMKGETEYYTHIKLKPGSVKNAEAIIKGQKGHRIIDNKYYPLRYSTWNIAADATSTFTSFTAPTGEKYWDSRIGSSLARH